MNTASNNKREENREKKVKKIFLILFVLLFVFIPFCYALVIVHGSGGGGGGPTGQWYYEDFADIATGNLDDDASWNTLSPDESASGDYFTVDGTNNVMVFDVTFIGAGDYENDSTVYQSATDTDDQCVLMKIDTLTEGSTFARLGALLRAQSTTTAGGYELSFKTQINNTEFYAANVATNGDAGSSISEDNTDHNIASGDWVGMCIKGSNFYAWDFGTSPPTGCTTQNCPQWDGDTTSGSNWGSYTSTFSDSTTATGKYGGMHCYNADRSAANDLKIDEYYFGDVND